MKTPNLKDRVRIKDTNRIGRFKLIPKTAKSKGIVTNVQLWEDYGELTIENHGSVEVKFDCGHVEHFTAYNFYEFFDDINTKEHLDFVNMDNALE